MSENYNQDVVGQLLGDLSDPEGLRDSEIIAQIRAVIAKEDNWKLYGPLSSKLLESLLYIDHRATRLAVAAEVLGWEESSRKRYTADDEAIFAQLAAQINAVRRATAALSPPEWIRTPRSTYDLVRTLSLSDPEPE